MLSACLLVISQEVSVNKQSTEVRNTLDDLSFDYRKERPCKYNKLRCLGKLELIKTIKNITILL